MQTVLARNKSIPTIVYAIRYEVYEGNVVRFQRFEFYLEIMNN